MVLGVIKQNEANGTYFLTLFIFRIAANFGSFFFFFQDIQNSVGNEKEIRKVQITANWTSGKGNQRSR
jgi:hypothetical protein